MGFFDKIKEAFSDFDDHVLQPIKHNPWEGIGDAISGLTKDVTGENLMKVAAKHDWVSDGAYDSYKGVTRTAATGAMIVGGVALAPVTGGASLAMTYGAGSGAGMSLMNGQSWNKSMTNSVQGGLVGASTALAPGAVQFSTAKNASTMATMGSNLGHNAVVYGLSGTGGAYAATGDMSKAIKFGAGSAVGASLAGGAGTGMTMASAASGGLSAMNLGNAISQSSGGTGTSSKSSDPNAGTDKQSTATKSNPQAEFIDTNGADWGNAGVGGVFGGLGKLHSGDTFVDTDKIKSQFALRKLGKFVK